MFATHCRREESYDNPLPPARTALAVARVHSVGAVSPGLEGKPERRNGAQRKKQAIREYRNSVAFDRAPPLIANGPRLRPTRAPTEPGRGEAGT